MTKVLHGIATVVNVGTKDKPKLVTVDGSSDLESLDAKTRKAVEAAGGLVDPEAPAAGESALTQATTVITPSSTVLQIAAYIETGGEGGKPLNAGQTVELAAGDAGQAEKVLQAEDLAHGGDGRDTVKKPLEKIMEDATSS